MTESIRAPRTSSVPRPIPKRMGQRDTEASAGTGQRDTCGTVDLKTLADRVLSRTQGGTRRGTSGGTEAQKVSQPPWDTPKVIHRLKDPPEGPCPHVTDPVLAEWHAENPKLVCARCWLEGRPTSGGRDSQENAPPTSQTNTTEPS